MPQAYEIPWAQLEFFSPASGGPPANVSVVEVAWPAGQPASASWPGAPAGWRIVASDEAAGWVAWRKCRARCPFRCVRPFVLRPEGEAGRGRGQDRGGRGTRPERLDVGGQ